jgi:hypothetical protein
MSHIYRDMNNVVDILSKVGVGLDRGNWIISVIHNENST